MNKDCLTKEIIKRFISGEILENERDLLELHLADCQDCRQDLVLMFSENADVENFVAPESLKEKVKKIPTTSKAKSASFFSFEWLKINRLQVSFATVLIVCFGLFGVYILQNRQGSNADDIWRNSSTNKNSLNLILPKENAEFVDEKIEFCWATMPNVKNYTLIISDEKGDIIKEIAGEKTQIVSTISELGLAKKHRYFWQIRASFTDGLTLESESRKIFIKAD